MDWQEKGKTGKMNKKKLVSDSNRKTNKGLNRVTMSRGSTERHRDYAEDEKLTNVGSTAKGINPVREHQD